jgi:DNA-directed RNA polymerase specialized sigma24 family protein
MDIRTLLREKPDVITACNKLTDNYTSDRDRAAELSQEVFLRLLEKDSKKPRDDWTAENLLLRFWTQVDPANSRMKRQLKKQLPRERLESLNDHPNAATVEPGLEIENLEILNQLPTNLRYTARLLYQQYTPAEIMSRQHISRATLYRRTIAIQESLL